MPGDTRRLGTWAYRLVLAALSLWILGLFLTPATRHSGLNLYEETRFPKMVQGTAHRPFVARTLLPSTVRVLTALTPAAWSNGLDRMTARHAPLRQTFDRLGWDVRGSLQYYYAALLMWFSFAGFAHVTVRLTCRELDWPACAAWRAALGAAALLGLPVFFKYSSFAYDPPQLFLFTLAVYLLSAGRLRAFALLFPFCCLAKETALLLVPLYALRQRSERPARDVVRTSGYLLIAYAVVKGGLTWVFRDNPGVFVEFHLSDHNLPWFRNGMSPAKAVVGLGIAALVFYRWRGKPVFLRSALLATLPVLVVVALFYGYIDEWRIYYEAYAVVFALSVATLRSLLRRPRATKRSGSTPYAS